MKARLGRFAIETAVGNIVDTDVDALVNASNTDLVLGKAGVAGAIVAAGGHAIQAQCDEISPIVLGEAVVTGSGNLRHRFVIHAAVLSLGLGGPTERTIEDATRNALRRANENRLKSVAMPALGTGAAGFSMDRAAKTMVRVLGEEGEKTRSVERVVLVLLTEQDRVYFDRALADRAIPEGRMSPAEGRMSPEGRGSSDESDGSSSEEGAAGSSSAEV